MTSLRILKLAAVTLFASAAHAQTPAAHDCEKMLEHFGVTEEGWRDAGKKDPNFC